MSGLHLNFEVGLVSDAEGSKINFVKIESPIPKISIIFLEVAILRSPNNGVAYNYFDIACGSNGHKTA